MTYTQPTRTRGLWLLTAGLLLLTTSLSFGQKRPGVPAVPPLAPALASDVERLEAELAELTQQRATADAAGRPLLEYRIDTRVLAWHLLRVAGRAEPGGEVQAVALLRAQDAMALAGLADAFTARLRDAAGLTPNEREALARFNALTYNLPAEPDLAALDRLLSQAAVFAGTGMSALPPGGLVEMRPGVSTPEDPEAGQDSLAVLAERARLMNVSEPLRRQLQAMAEAAARPDADPAVLATLREAVTLSRAMQSNTAVTAEDRRDLEGRMTEALALYADNRLREAGLRRLGAVREYGRVVEQMNAVQLTGRTQAALLPAVTWARQNPDEGKGVLEAVGRFAEEEARYAGLPQNVNAPQSFLRPLGLAKGHFVAERDAFIEEAANLGTASLMAPTPQQLLERTQQMARWNDIYLAMSEANTTASRLRAYAPRATGMERRMLSAAVTATATTRDDARAAAGDYLLNLARLAELEARLAPDPLSSLDAQMLTLYTNDAAGEAFGQAWRGVLTRTLASAEETGQIDTRALAHMTFAAELVDAVVEAQAYEMIVTQAATVTGWADFSPDATALTTALEPLRRAYQTAFASVAAGQAGGAAAADLRKVRRQYEPLLALLREAATYEQAVARLPDGAAGIVSRLGTPSAEKPFARQRLASLHLRLMAHYSQDAEAWNATLASLTRTLRTE
ncbi:MAG: hypothetical protein ACFCVE_12850 [Phycisphaerae bacterium]